MEEGFDVDCCLESSCLGVFYLPDSSSSCDSEILCSSFSLFLSSYSYDLVLILF
jgi:hypothetical protein